MAAPQVSRQGSASKSSIVDSEQIALIVPPLPELSREAAGALLKLLCQASDSRTREPETLSDPDTKGYSLE